MNALLLAAVLAASASGAPQTREGYQKKIQAELDEIESSILSLEAKSKSAGAGARRRLAAQARRLRAKKGKAERELAKLKSATESAWEDFKDGLDKAVADLKAAHKKAADKLKSD